MPRTIHHGALAVLACLAACAQPVSATDIVLLAESAPAGDVVILQVDLTSVWATAKIDPIRPEAVIAVDASGRPLASQFIPAADFDPQTRAAGSLLCRLPDDFDGKLRLRLNGPAAPESPAFDGTVRTTQFEIVHRADVAGGFPSAVTFAKSGKKLAGLLWLDRLYDKDLGQFLAAQSPENSVERICDGPLATVVRVKTAYTQSGKRPETAPGAVYDWIYLKDSPLVLVTADVRQETPFTWGELHFLELHSKGGELPKWIGGEPQASGELAGKDASQEFADWAAFTDGANSIGFIKAGNALLYDGKGFGPYLIPRRRLNWGPWHETAARRRAWMWIGSSDDPAAALREADATVPRVLPAVASTANLVDRIAVLEKSTKPEDRRRAMSAALLQSLGRTGDALAAAQGKLPSGWHTLDAGELSVVLEKTGGGIVVRGVVDAKTNRLLTATDQPPLLELEFCTPLTEDNAKDYDPEEVLLGSDTGWKSVGVERTVEGLTIRLSDPTDARLAGVRATLVAKPSAEQNGVAWSLAVESKAENRALANVRFPQIALGEFADDMRLLVPHCCGEIERNPCRRAYRFDNLYPNGWCTMEFEAVYSPSKRTGLYWAMHDPRGSAKRIRAIGDPAAASLMLGFEHPVPDMRKQGTGYELPGTAQWRLLRGDWFDAASIYRDWVRKEALWFPELGDNGRTDTPQWMKELSVWALAAGDAKTVVPAVKKFQEYLGVPVGVHWYQWHEIPFDNDYPHYFPVKEGFAEGVAELKRSNVYVMPYINGRLWDTHDREAEDWQFTKTALPGATKDEKGAPLTETYRSLEKDGKKVALAAMCPTTKIWQDKVAEIIDRLFNEYGVNGVYVDQVAAATPKLCFDASHGHPLGGGSWWNEGYWKMFDRIRAEMPKDRMLTTECNADPFTKWFDGFLSWHWQSNEQVPAFSAVYGGAIQMFGRAYKGGETKDLALRMKAGQQLCFGEQIGWIDPGVINPNGNASHFPLRPDEAKTPASPPTEAQASALFFRRIVRLRHAFRRYFYAGEMARPPKIDDDVPTVTADWQWHKEWVTTPAVLTGAWRLPKEGKTVLFLVNVSDAPVTTVVSFDAAEYGFDRFPISATIHAEEGKTSTLSIAKPSFEVTLPPRCAQAWELTPTLSAADIRVRDPFILADPLTKKYYLYANAENRSRRVKGWECYVSEDLKYWEKPVTVFTPPRDYWADRNFWAPEVFHYRDKYWLFGTVFKQGLCRGTQIFVADKPLGPFRPHSDRAVTPHDWFALDGTLLIEDGKPWIVFCHEWVQIQDGTMEAAPLSDDLKTLAAKPKTLFHASDAPWKRPGDGKNFVTDGPCLYRHSNGALLMLWSSFGTGDYTVGIARSTSGKVLGPWTQDEKPLYENGGHCSIVRTFSGETLLALHGPNFPPKERLCLFRIEETGDSLRLTGYSP